MLVSRMTWKVCPAPALVESIVAVSRSAEQIGETSGNSGEEGADPLVVMWSVPVSPMSDTLDAFCPIHPVIKVDPTARAAAVMIRLRSL